MGIWIRSQNKRALVNANDISYMGCWCGKSGNYVTNDSTINSALLGAYVTEERALQVMDEIQKLICYDGYMQDSNFIVFQMPAE